MGYRDWNSDDGRVGKNPVHYLGYINIINGLEKHDFATVSVKCSETTIQPPASTHQPLPPDWIPIL